MKPAEVIETKIALHDFFEIKTTDKSRKQTIIKIVDGWDLQGALDNFEQTSASANSVDKVTLTYYVTTLTSEINGKSPGISPNNGRRFGVKEFASEEVQKITLPDWLGEARKNAQEEIDEYYKDSE